MNNKELIELVDKLSSVNDFSEILEDEENRRTYSKNDNYKKKIGISQFRDIANMCKKVECSEEIKLLIQYKTAKGNGWNNIIGDVNNKKKVGDLVIDYIEKIQEKFKKDEKGKIEAISKFFGYLFWKSKVIKSN